MSNLAECSWINTKPFLPHFTQGKCIKVYDCDTITVAAEVGGSFYRFQIRLYGIDGPEMKSANPLEKEKAKIARDKMAAIILDKIVIVHIISSDKYGRLLSKVITTDGVDMSEHLLSTGLALPYFGKTKNPWTTSALEKIV